MSPPRRGAGAVLTTALRTVEFHILLSLAAGDRHGYAIIQDIAAGSDTLVPDVVTMDRALARMVEAGFIAPAARRPAADAGDERRDYDRITARGGGRQANPDRHT